MAKATESKSVNAKYVSLKVFGKRRIFLIFMALAMTGFFGFLLAHNVTKDHNELWLHAGLPIIGLGLLGMLLPLSEEWNYLPWQDATQRCEKSTYN